MAVIVFIALAGIGAGLLAGIWFASRYRTVSEGTWRAYLANLNSPKAVASAKDGQILYANRSCQRTFSIQDDTGSYAFSSKEEQALISSFIRQQQWPVPFTDVTVDFRPPGSRSAGIVALVSGLPIWCEGTKAWVITMEATHGYGTAVSFSGSDNQIFKSVINSLAELVCFQDIEGRVVGTNTAFDRFWADREQEGLFFSADERLDSRRTTQCWTTNPNGESCLLETSQTVLRDAKNRICGTLSISHDVTNWHRMQHVLEQEIEHRQTVEQELKKRSNLLESIFKASVDPIGVFNEHYVYLGCNAAFAESMGAEIDDLEGKRAEDVIDPEILAQYRKVEQQVIEDGGTVKYEDLVMKRDGSQVWYEVTKSQFKDPTDDTVGVLAMARDVTGRKETQQQLADAIMELQELSFVDSLTKVANRRSFDEQLVKLWQAHSRDQKPLSLILCDIDYFKAYNDNYGHQSGDGALQKVASVFKRVIHRPMDEVARYGGEEFAILLPDTDIGGATVVANNIRDELAKAAIPHEFSDVSNTLTISQGVATLIPAAGQDYGVLVHQADKALYRAKHAGRDRLACNHPPVCS